MIEHPYNPFGDQTKRACLDELLAQVRALEPQSDPVLAEQAVRIQELIEEIATRKAPPLTGWAGFKARMGLERPSYVRWRDIAALELMVVALRSEEDAERRCQVIQERLRQFVSPEEFSRYTASARQTSDGAAPAKPKPRLQNLISLLLFQIDLKSKLNRLRDRLGAWSCLVAILLLGIGIGYTWIEYAHATSRIAAAETAHLAPRGAPRPNVLVVEENPVKKPVDLLATAGQGRVYLSWKDMSAIEQEFKIERRVADGDWTLIGTAVRDSGNYVDNDIHVGRRHEYRVAAVTAAEASTPSASASAKPRAYSVPARVPIFVFVIVMGALGGFVGMQRRLRQTSDGSALLVATLELETGKLVTGLMPLFGAVFAVVLYLVFAAGLVEGDFFPRIYPSSDPFEPPSGMTTFGEFLLLAHPVMPADVAKVLVWSFVAGFAERLVPDSLDRIAARQQTASSPGGGVGVPGAPGSAAPGSAADTGKGAAAEAARAALLSSAAVWAGVGAASVLPAEIASISPDSGAVVPPDASLNIRFNKSVCSADVAVERIGEEPVEFEQELSADGLTLTLTRSAPMLPGDYELQLSALVLSDGAEVDIDVQRAFSVQPLA